MPTLTLTKDYEDGKVLTEAHLDNILSATMTFFNNTKLSSVNFQDTGVSWANLTSSVKDYLPPLGSILPWFHYSGLSAEMSTSYYAFCDGSTITTIASLGSVSLPDMSDRYLVGFGTEGGGDIGTATWSAAAVGNVTHATSISHTHTGPSHTHGAGSYQFRIGAQTTTSFGMQALGTGNYVGIVGAGIGDNTGSANLFAITANTETYYTKDGTGSSGADGTGVTGNPGGAEDAQPRSMRVRYIMRIA